MLTLYRCSISQEEPASFRSTGLTHSQIPTAGYAGGLGPSNLAAELERINKAASDQAIWIDMETHIRSNADLTFDLNKAVKCLELSLPWIDPANHLCEQEGL